MKKEGLKEKKIKMEEKINGGGENKKRIIWAVVAVVIIIVGVFLFFNFRSETEEISDKVVSKEILEEGKLYVVTDPLKPYSYEEDGEYKGIAYDLLDLVMTRLDVDYEFELLPWSRVLKVAEAGEADGVLSGAHSIDREQYIAYTSEQLDYGRQGIKPPVYLHEFNGAFFILKLIEDTFVYESIEQLELNNYRVGVQQGYKYREDVDNANWSKVTQVTVADGMQALVDGEIDLLMTYKEVGLAIRDDLGLKDEISVAKGIAPFETYYFLLFSKNSDYPNWQDLQLRVDEELKKIHESGEYQKIYDKYVKE